MKTYKMSYTYVIMTIKTGEIEVEAETANDKLTEKEKIVLQAYIEDEFCDSGVDSTLWADAFSDNLKARGLNARTRSGVLSSLNKKGYIISRSGYRYAVLMLTDKGKEYIKKTFNIA